MRRAVIVECGPTSYGACVPEPPSWQAKKARAEVAGPSPIQSNGDLTLGFNWSQFSQARRGFE